MVEKNTSLAPKLLVIVGPTASGKSSLAMKLAEEFNGEIICADSRTVYRHMNIGTAKPSAADQKQIPHHALDVVDPNESFTAAQFKRIANSAITDIAGRGRLPIIVGGTGLYIDAVLYDYQFGSKADEKLRAELNSLGDTLLLERLRSVVGDSAHGIFQRHKNNRRRIIRAIEQAGENNRRAPSIRPNTLVLGIEVNKETIRERITTRANLMLKEGITREVKMIGERFGWESEAMSGNIYRIFSAVIKKQKTVDEALAEFIASDLRLVKKQLTWFKRNHEIVWLNGENPDKLSHEASSIVADFLSARIMSV